MDLIYKYCEFGIKNIETAPQFIGVKIECQHPLFSIFPVFRLGNLGRRTRRRRPVSCVYDL